MLYISFNISWSLIINGFKNVLNTVRPVTSIKQTPVLKGHNFLVLLLKISYELYLFQEVTCLIRPLFLCPKGDLWIQVRLYISFNISWLLIINELLKCLQWYRYLTYDVFICLHKVIFRFWRISIKRSKFILFILYGFIYMYIPTSLIC